MNDFSEDLAKILDDYSDKTAKAIEHAEKTAASTTVRELKARAPRDKGRTGYERSFASKKEGFGRDSSYTVYSRKPGLTHLLENGHMIRNQYGTYGRTNGQDHWATAERIGNEKFEQEIRSKLGG